MIYDHKPSRSRQGVSHKPLVSDQKITLKLFHAVMPAKNGFGVSLPFQLLCIPCDFAQSGISRLWIYGTFSSTVSSSVVLDAAMVNNWLVGWNHRWNLPVFPKFRGEDPNI